MIPRMAVAQTEAATGVLTGVVADSSGAVMPNVAVEVRHHETGFLRHLQSAGDGGYRAALLPLGHYTITVTSAGFATLKRTGIELRVGQELKIDLVMQPASAGEVVTVEAEAPAVETTRYDRTQVISRRSIADLPVNGRDFTDFVALTPTATVIPSNNGKRITVGSGSDVTTGLSLDGADFKAPFRGFQSGATAPFIISQEAVSEFEVVRAGFSAEFGRAQGGRINVVTKSGANDVHGSAFYYVRDSALGPDDAFGRKLDYRRQQVGGSVGGPIQRNRLFFFTAYDRQQANFPTFVNLPPALIDAANRVIPQLKLADQTGMFDSTNDGSNFFLRGDWNIASAHQITARYNLLRARSNNVFNDPNRAIGAQRDQINNVDSVVGSYNFAHGRFLNEFRVQWTRDSQPVVRNALGAPYPTALILVDGQNYRIGGQDSDIDPFFQNRKQVTDNLSIQRGKHFVKFGVDLNFTNLNEFFASNARGLFNFASLADFDARKPNNFTQFVPLRGLTPQQAGTIVFDTHEAALFIQDKWRIHPRLTIDAGFRWEGQWNQNAITNPDFPLSGPVPSPIGNLAPRLGISWDPAGTSKTVVRAGAGIFFARSDGVALVRVFDTNATKGARVTLQPNGPGGNLIPVFPNAFTNFGALPPTAIPLLDVTYISPDFKLPRALQWTAGIERQLARDLTVTVDFELANTVHGNLFRNTNLFPASAQDKDGRPIYDRTKRPVAQFNRLQAIESSSRAGYDAFVIAVNKRYARRFQLQGSYTYSHQRDNSADGFNRVMGLVTNDSFNTKGDFGYANSDVRHRLVASGVVDLPLGIVLANIINWQTGLPFNGTLPNDANNDGNLTDRPYRDGRVEPFNNYRQPRYFNWNLRLLKRFRLPSENKRLELSAEFFNLTNASNLTTTNTTIGRATFGVLNVAGAPFQSQFGARYVF